MGGGRHRKESVGRGRHLRAALSVVVVLGLIGVGAYSLYSVLTTPSQLGTTPAAAPAPGSAEPSGPSGSAQRSPGRARGSPASGAGENSLAPTLAVRVTGARCYVSVRVPDGKVLLNETLRRGETARFGQPALEVTIGNPDAARVRVNGQLRQPAQGGIDTFTVSPGQ